MWSRKRAWGATALLIGSVFALPGAAQPGAVRPRERVSPLQPAPSEFPPRESEGGQRPEPSVPLGSTPAEPPLLLSGSRLALELERAERAARGGQERQALRILSRMVGSPGFPAFAGTREGRTVRVRWGQALASVGARKQSREVLAALLREAPRAGDIFFNAAAEALVDLALHDPAPESTLALLRPVSTGISAGLMGDIAYAEGRAAERMQQWAAAAQFYARVGAPSRYWAQATYRASLLELDAGRPGPAKDQLCRIADPRRTPQLAEQSGGAGLRGVRQQARLALGRIAHEERRFDDAAYYYHWVSEGSEQLPAALYEAATTRYEGGDYAGARDLLAELRRRYPVHSYADEAHLLAAHVALSQCQFSSAEAELRTFVRRYAPVRDAARSVIADRVALRGLADSVRIRSASGGPSPIVSNAVAGELRFALAGDPAFIRLAWQHAQLSEWPPELAAAELAAAQSALGRLEARLTRLLSHARLARAEILLGRRRSLRIEIDALAQGYLPASMVDSLDVSEPLREDEEYWPDEGESWPDETTGGVADP